MGWRLLASKSTNTASVPMLAHPTPITGAEVQPVSGASMIVHSSRPRPAIDNSAPAGSASSADGFFESGTNAIAARKATTAMGTLTMKIEPHQKWARSRPPAIGPIAMPSPMVPPQAPMARARPDRVGEDVVDDRQRRRDRQRPADAHDGPAGDQHLHRTGEGGPDRSRSEDRESEQEEPPAAEAVREAAGDQQQTREDHGVGVHDPLQVRRGCVQLPDKGGEGDVEDRVVQIDDQRRGTHDGEGETPSPP